MFDCAPSCRWTPDKGYWRKRVWERLCVLIQAHTTSQWHGCNRPLFPAAIIRFSAWDCVPAPETPGLKQHQSAHQPQQPADGKPQEPQPQGHPQWAGCSALAGDQRKAGVVGSFVYFMPAHLGNLVRCTKSTSTSQDEEHHNSSASKLRNTPKALLSFLLLFSSFLLPIQIKKTGKPLSTPHLRNPQPESNSSGCFLLTESSKP